MEYNNETNKLQKHAFDDDQKFKDPMSRWTFYSLCIEGQKTEINHLENKYIINCKFISVWIVNYHLIILNYYIVFCEIIHFLINMNFNILNILNEINFAILNWKLVLI